MMAWGPEQGQEEQEEQEEQEQEQEQEQEEEEEEEEQEEHPHSCMPRLHHGLAPALWTRPIWSSRKSTSWPSRPP